MLNSGTCEMPGTAGSVRSRELREADGSEIVIAMFRGLRCAERPTSCPDQIAQALEQYLTGAAQPQ